MRELHNNYIYLPKTQEENKKKKKCKSNTNHETKTVYDYLEDLFGASIEGNYNFKGIYEYSGNIIVKNSSSKVLFTLKEVSSYIYMDVCVCEKRLPRAIRVMEYVNEQLNRSEIENHYIMIISYDSVSEYFCNKAYPVLDKLVRNLYRLLYDIYTVNYGEQYLKSEAIPNYIQTKVKRNISQPDEEEVKGSENPKDSKDIRQLKDFFYAIGFSEAETLLFNKRWTQVDEDRKNKFLKQNKDLLSLSDKELRDAFSEFSVKSDWERFFADDVGDIDAEGLMKSISDFRNIIAHCKIFTRMEYKTFNKASTELNDAILNAIKSAETEDFQENEPFDFKASLENLRNEVIQFQKSIQPFVDSIVKPQGLAKDIAIPIDTTINSTGNGKFNDLINSLGKLVTNSYDSNKDIENLGDN